MNVTDLKIRPQDLDELHDVYGNELTVGCFVRSFDFAEQIGDIIYGLETEGERVSYVEGVLLSYGQDGETIIEGCARYTIRAITKVFSRDGKIESRFADERLIYPPLNSTPTSRGGFTFGVVRIEEIQ